MKCDSCNRNRGGVCETGRLHDGKSVYRSCTWWRFTPGCHFEPVKIEERDQTVIDKPEASQVEEWRDVPGYEGSYMVSNLKRVKSIDRYHLHKNGHIQFFEGMVLKPCGRSKNGYGLSKNNKVKWYKADELYYMAFDSDDDGSKDSDGFVDIPGYEGRYVINRKGIVRSLDREIDRGKSGIVHKRGIEMKECGEKIRGYHLHKNGFGKWYRTDHLLNMAFGNQAIGKRRDTEFRYIPGYEGRYKANQRGEVISCVRKHEKKLMPDNGRYRLAKDGKTKRFSSGKIIEMTFGYKLL